jgi:hypothetical protein
MECFDSFCSAMKQMRWNVMKMMGNYSNSKERYKIKNFWEYLIFITVFSNSNFLFNNIQKRNSSKNQIFCQKLKFEEKINRF